MSACLVGRANGGNQPFILCSCLAPFVKITVVHSFPWPKMKKSPSIDSGLASLFPSPPEQEVGQLLS